MAGHATDRAERDARQRAPASARGSIVLDALSSWLVAGLVIVSGLLFAPLINGSMGDAGYGLWRTLFQVIGYCGVLELGIRAAAIRFLAIAWSEQDDRAMRGILGACLAFAAILVASIVPGTLLFADRIVALLGAEGPLASDGVLALRIMAVTFGLSAFSGILAFSIHGACRIELANRVELTTLALRTGLGLLALLKVGTLAALAAANAVAAVVGLVGYLWLFPRLYSVRPSFAQARRFHWLHRVLRFAGKIYAVKLGDLLTNDVLLVLVASLFTLELAGVLGYVLALAGFATILIVQLCDAMYPRLSAVHADRSRLTAATLAQGQVVATVAFALLGGFVVLGAPFIRTWIGPDVGRAAGVSLPALVAIVGVTRLLTLATLPAVYALRAADRVEVYALFNLLEGVVGVGLMVLAARGFGLLGVASASLAAAAAFRLVALPLYAGRVLDVPSGRIVAALVGRPALTLLGALPLGVLVRTAAPSGWIEMAGMLLGAGALLLGTGFALGMASRSRSLLVERLLGVVGRARPVP